jgi:hypothetical protein
MNRPSIWSWRNAIRKSSLPPLAKLCCYVLADYMSDAGKGCFPSIVTLMKDTGLSNTSIAKHLRLAVEAGLLVKHRFRDRAGHCTGTNYYPRFPERVDEEPAAEPATLGAAAFFDVPETPETAKIEPAARPSRRSPWADYPPAESLSEPSSPDEFQPVPALTPLTHNCPIEPSNRKLLQHALDENRDQGGAERLEPAHAAGEPRASRDETEIAFVAWMRVAERLSIPTYASQLTVARRSMLHKALSAMGGLEAWTAILERLPKARFLLGQGKRGFWISLEALCSESIRVKLLEGAYDHVPGEAKPPTKPVQVSQVSDERWRERVKNWLTAGKAALDAWPASWGPAPGAEGCLVPADCLAGVPA